MSVATSGKAISVHLTCRVLNSCDCLLCQQELNPESVDATMFWESFGKLEGQTNFFNMYLRKSILLKYCTLQVSRLETTPGLRTLANLPVINGLITSFLPSVILRIFLKLLPNLLGFMSHVQGMTSLSQVDFGVLRKYFIFQV